MSGIRSNTEMGYKKFSYHTQDAISGLHQQNDIPDGEHSASDLSAHNDARQADLNKRIKADWPNDQTDSASNAYSHPSTGDAYSRSPKPSDAVQGSAPRYGM